MLLSKSKFRILLGVFFFTLLFFGCDNASVQADWPEIGIQEKPWTRWWWQGSSVTKEGITADLESLQKSGVGGVELTPIYGVIGDEDNFIEYLSPQWMEMLEHTLNEAQRLGMGVDMATGTGWPFGGPWVHDDNACKYLAHKKYRVTAGEKLKGKIIYPEDAFVRAVTNQVYQLFDIYREDGEQLSGSLSDPKLIAERRALEVDDLIDPVEANEDLQGKALDQVRFNRLLPLQTLMAYGPGDQIVDLTSLVDNQGNLDWTAPEGDWNLYAIFQGWHGKMVERAAPGGEGNVIDHFSVQALQSYLTKFDSAFSGHDIESLRAFFCDSYEVDDARGQANWTPHFLAEFKVRRGYDLRQKFPALFGEATEEENIRVLSDFRETFSDLILEQFTQPWAQWARSKGKIIRNQSHGAPANILDLYAASDIPETEGTEILRIKFASSASHVAGHTLTSAEAATWLNEHFLSNLSDVKQNLDRYLIGGVNHIFYHGTCYSPTREEWPGRLFYAAIHNNNRNPLWHDWPALNTYIARVQSFLQKGDVDNDVLLYFPMYDRFATPGKELLEHFDGHGPTLEGTDLEAVALDLYEQGFTFDFISDRQISNVKVDQGILTTGGNTYKTIVLPPCHFIPLATMNKLKQLAEEGATIIFKNNLPLDVPGLGNLKEKREEFQSLIQGLHFSGSVGELAKGKFLKGEDLSSLMEQISIKRETFVDHGLEFVRRKFANSHLYFITNWSDHNFDGWIDLSVDFKDAIIFDPMTGIKGVAKIRNENGTQVYLQLAHGQGLIVQAGNKISAESSWRYYQNGQNEKDLEGTWTVKFLDGGPELPADLQIKNLQSWSALAPEYQVFSGRARYTIEFPFSGNDGQDWVLDLGQVHESAEVSLNDSAIGTLIGPNYRILIERNRLKENNILEIEVSNLMANRIADMDKRNIYWKKFYNVNFPPRRAENRGKNGLFDASAWQPLPSGLLGPVRLHPIKEMVFN